MFFSIQIQVGSSLLFLVPRGVSVSTGLHDESKRRKQNRSLFPCKSGLVRKLWSPRSLSNVLLSHCSVVCDLHSQGPIIVQYGHCHPMNSHSNPQEGGKGYKERAIGQRKMHELPFKGCSNKLPWFSGLPFYWPEFSCRVTTWRTRCGWEIE